MFLGISPQNPFPADTGYLGRPGVDVQLCGLQTASWKLLPGPMPSLQNEKHNYNILADLLLEGNEIMHASGRWHCP